MKLRHLCYLLLFILLTNCTKWNLPKMPSITTSAVTISNGIANCGGNVTSDGGKKILAKGICWSTDSIPTVYLATKTEDSTESGSFSSTINFLVPNAIYHVRAYATNEIGTAYGNEVIFSTSTFLLGKHFQGGIIGYVLELGDLGYDPLVDHGLVVAENEQSLGIKWSNGFSTPNVVTTDTVLGSGMNNTNLIISIQGNGSYAASLCKNLSINGYNDWYLPSKLELDKIYKNRNYTGGFNSQTYWSSSSVHSDAAWAIWNGVFVPYYDKRGECAVRAVRSF